MNRLFIALPISHEVKSPFKSVYDYLKKHNDVLNIEPLDNYHITIKFIGEIEEDIGYKISDNFNQLKLDIPPIKFKLHALGAFPQINKANTIWCGINTDSDKLNELYNCIEDFVHSFGIEKENRKFKPHLTLARVKKKKTIPDDLINYITNNKDTFYCESTFNSVVLYESKLTAKGSIYTELNSIDLV